MLFIGDGEFQKAPGDEELSTIEWFRKYLVIDFGYTKKNYKQFIRIMSPLFEKIYDKLNFRWVDIENEYFKEMINVASDLSLVENLNNDFTYIRLKLLEYLLRQQDSFGVNLRDDFVKYFSTHNPDQILFLNFNYTNIIEQYVDPVWKRINFYGKKINPDSIAVNYIHGSLDGDHGQPIFGIGDEHHKEYEKLKEMEYLVDLFKYNKASWYLKNHNYSRLL